MKKIICLLLCLAMLLPVLTGCGNTQPAETTGATEETVPDDGVLKILAIGNSFSEDATHLLYQVAQAEGKEQIVIGNLFIGGCSLATHAKNVKDIGDKDYTFFYNNSGVWKTEENTKILHGLRRDDWDIITLQQASHASGKVSTYNEDIQTITSFVQENKLNPGAKMLWHMTWAYRGDSTSDSFAPYNNDQMTMYNMIVGAVQEKIVTDDAFSDVLPVGTAIQNARSSYLGDTMNRDGSHLSDLGRVIAAYVWYCKLTGKTLDTINLAAVPARLTKSYEMPGDMVLTEGEKLVIAEAVKNAIANPFTVTQSQYTTEPGK